MIYRSIAFVLMAIFYILYFAKIIAQKRRGINSYKLAKKEGKTQISKTEMALKIASFLLPVIELISMIIGRSYLPIMGKVLGVYLIAFADLLFLNALVSMKDSWRVGVDREDTNRKLITTGIYSFSRNPAFLAFDLMYIGIALMYCNIVLIICTIITIVIFHLQILQEEKFLEETMGGEYISYKKKAGRYVGYGKLSFLSVRMYAYFILFIWCIFYIITLIFYAGIFLSWLWIWVLIGAFALLRFYMLKKAIDTDKRLKLHQIIKVIYYIFFTFCLCVFLLVEFNVFRCMSVKPLENLDYVIVLGAGVNGERPSIPLAKRIEEAYIYMSENPNTVLIASGGQGSSEDISEAECIKRELVKMGISENRILLEDKSTSTMENLEFSKRFIGRKGSEIGIITNSFHEYRATLIARQAGYETIHPVPAPTLMPVGIHYMLREFFGVVRLWIEYKKVIL